MQLEVKSLVMSSDVYDSHVTNTEKGDGSALHLSHRSGYFSGVQTEGNAPIIISLSSSHSIYAWNMHPVYFLADMFPNWNMTRLLVPCHWRDSISANTHGTPYG